MLTTTTKNPDKNHTDFIHIELKTKNHTIFANRNENNGNLWRGVLTRRIQEDFCGNGNVLFLVFSCIV